MPLDAPAAGWPLQREMHDFVESRGWYSADSAKPQEPRNLAISLALEAAEVLEHFQWGETVDVEALSDELADVVLYAVQLANVVGIDIDQAARAKLELNRSRWGQSHS